MPESATILRLPQEARDLAPAQRLSREVAILSGRLADLLARLAIAQDSALAGGQAFLASMFDAWAEGKPVSEFAGSALERKPAGPLHRRQGAGRHRRISQGQPQPAGADRGPLRRARDLGVQPGPGRATGEVRVFYSISGRFAQPDFMEHFEKVASMV